MPVIFDKTDLRLWLTKIRLSLNGSGAELLRAAAEDRVRLWPSRRVNKTSDGDDDGPTLVNEATV
jgi:hypothetical protein